MTIRAYPDRPSVNAGDDITFHVSSNSQWFRIDFYRQGEDLALIDSQRFDGANHFSDGNAETPWGWQPHTFAVPEEWESGVYIAMLFELARDGREISHVDTSKAWDATSQALFVVKNPDPGSTACILYKVPYFTYQAYNNEGGSSLYTGSKTVTFHRPGGGTGGTPWDFRPFPDAYDGDSPRQTFAHWDAKFIAWLEANFDCDYCTDLDVHENAGNFLANYNLIVSVGHDEYWSAAERANVEQFIRAGGNVAFFSGNVCWWRVALNGTEMTCDKSDFGNGIAVDQWYRTNAENKLTGVSYRNGGGAWNGSRDALGYSVEEPAHWIFNGTGLANGDVFGADERVVGYESDGAQFVETQNGRVATGNDGTPLDFIFLATAFFGNLGWDDREGDSTATMGIYSNHGHVFTAATTDWARLLDANETVQQISGNVIRAFERRAVRIIGPLPATCGSSLAVEGERAHFRVSAPAANGKLHYEWNVIGANATPSDKPTLDADMLSPPRRVDISVVITEEGQPDGCGWFGTISFVPLTLEQFARVQLICALRTAVIMAAQFYIPLEGSKNRFPFVDPIWDPIRGERAITLGNAREIANAARMVAQRAEQLVRVIEREGNR